MVGDEKYFNLEDDMFNKVEIGVDQGSGFAGSENYSQNILPKPLTAFPCSLVEIVISTER